MISETCQDDYTDLCVVGLISTSYSCHNSKWSPILPHFFKTNIGLFFKQIETIFAIAYLCEYYLRVGFYCLIYNRSSGCVIYDNILVDWWIPERTQFFVWQCNDSNPKWVGIEIKIDQNQIDSNGFTRTLHSFMVPYQVPFVASLEFTLESI